LLNSISSCFRDIAL